MIARACLMLTSLVLVAGCATSEDQWRALKSEGPLTQWANCMEGDGYRAWVNTGMEAAAARQDGATPLSDSQIFRVALAKCETLDAVALDELSTASRNRLYRVAEQRFLRIDTDISAVTER